MRGSKTDLRLPAARSPIKVSAPHPLLALAALGIVFGDIGTSPLYTFKTILTLTSAQPSPDVILGVLSLVIWTLVVVTTIKYVTIAMSLANDGEGGILALMSLLALKKHKRPVILAFGLFGAALIYGDGAITPAISVLSSLEGLDIAMPALHDYVLPAAVAVLMILFAIQPLGSARIGHAFGPVMALWFMVIGALGLWGIAQNPAVLASLNPLWGLRYLMSHGSTGFVVLGGVFLCVTGAEALYADMGHFGSGPIRLAWSVIVFPSLLLNYAGQAAIVLGGASIRDNIFFRLCPGSLLMPLIVLSTIATIIASQSIITGAFSMTRQAIQLGWMPRLAIRHTSAEGYGQIYVGTVNWILAAVTIGLTLFFRRSDHLAAAYGIAVSLTMLMTSILLFIAMREIRGWSLLRAGLIAAVLLCVDVVFFGANAMKVLDGGYVPLVLAVGVFTVMVVWHRGTLAVGRAVNEKLMTANEFFRKLESDRIPRVPGTAVFLTGTTEHIPTVMSWHVKHNRALHQTLLILTVTSERVPRINDSERLTVVALAPNCWRAGARYGFMERPDIPALLRQSHDFGCNLDLEDVTYYVGRETIVGREDKQGMARWEERFFAAMVRNSAHVSEVFLIPREGLVEIGPQIAI